MHPDDIEEWRPVTRAPEYYEVSNLGRVRRAVFAPPPHSGPHNPGLVYRPVNNRKGYLYVSVSAGGRRMTFPVHRIVAETFLPPPPTAAHTVDHIDDNSLNNRADNLQWLTRQEQIHKAIRAGRLGTPNWEGLARRDWRIQRQSLTDEMVQIIRHAPKRFTYQDLADLFGVGIGTISRVMNSKVYKDI
jgi:HNH endonuclease/NUMOD4 motif